MIDVPNHISEHAKGSSQVLPFSKGIPGALFPHDLPQQQVKQVLRIWSLIHRNNAEFLFYTRSLAKMIEF